MDRTEAAYAQACERYGELSVDTDAALEQLSRIAVSLQCWQGDDVTGFEGCGQPLGGGLAVTGNYLGRARNADELRADLELAISLIPGPLRLNLHACYGEAGGERLDRTNLEPRHFASWVEWARQQGMGLDFNPTYFAHPLAADGWTLSHPDTAIRQFWIDHGIICRRIGASFGRQLGTPCVNNLWIPDGSKDLAFDRRGPRERLRESLDLIYAEPWPEQQLLDAVECKLFGLGSESYVVGSHEFYLGYAASRRKVLCLDSGHFHPTEAVADKISAVMQWVPRVLLHVSRGVRWDSDHVVILNDESRAIAEEVVRGGYLDRVHFGLDFFDASINRIAAWVIGCRSLLKSLLIALLEPQLILREAEVAGNLTARLAWFEELKSLPWAAVWDMHCLRSGVPTGAGWLARVQQHEREVLQLRR